MLYLVGRERRNKLGIGLSGVKQFLWFISFLVNNK